MHSQLFGFFQPTCTLYCLWDGKLVLQAYLVDRAAANIIYFSPIEYLQPRINQDYRSII